MPPANRPIAVVAMAVINFVFGGLAICCCGCFGMVFLLLPAFANRLPKDAANMQVDMLLELPAYRALNVASAFLGVAMALFLVISTSGLLAMRPWGRFGCIAYAVLQIIIQMAEFIVGLLFMGPMVREWQADWYTRHSKLNPETSNTFADNALGFGLEALVIGHALALLIVMFLPSMTAAFADRSLVPEPGAQDYPDSPLDEVPPR
jgi:hypothetical protein